MPEMWMDVDTALSEVPVNLLALTDDTDFKSREISIAYNAAGMDLVWNFTTSAGVFTQTAVTPTTAGDYDWVHQGDGIYSIEIPASGGASINNDTEGAGWFSGIATGVLSWRGPVIGLRAAALNNAMIDGGDVLDVNITELGGVTQSATDLKDFADDGYDPATNKVQGVVLVDTTTANTDMRGTDSAALAANYSATRAGYLDNINGHTPQTGDNFARLGAPAGASVSADVAAIEAQTDDIGAAGAGLAALPWNAAWDAQVESEVTDALNAYNGPTSAEMDARTLLAANYATAANLATVDGIVDAILIDTDTTIPALIAALNNLSAAQANAEVDTALADIHLDHLLATDYDPASKPGIGTALLNELIESDAGISRYTANALEQSPAGSAPTAVQIRQEIDSNSTQLADILARIGAFTTGGVNTILGFFQALMRSDATTPTDIGGTYDDATDSVQAIRDRGDAAWTTGAGGSDRLLMVDTTIATLASQVSFTLTSGSIDDGAYVNCTAVIEDVSTSTQKAIGLISTYIGATKTVTLKYNPGVFTMATTDKIYILAENSLKSTGQNRQLDVTATGAAGVDWANVENPSTAVDLSATDIQLVDTATTVTDKADYALSSANRQAVVDDILNEVISKSAHNDPNSVGKYIRRISSNFIWEGTAQGPGTGPNQIQLDTGASSVNNAYDPAAVAIIDGTGAGQSRLSLEYVGSTRTMTVDRDWDVSPDATSEFIIVPDAGRGHVNEGLAQGGTASSITLNSQASSSDDIYIRQRIFIVSGTGAGQVGRGVAYNGTTKVLTVAQTWATTPDTTSGYVMLPDAPALFQGYESAAVWLDTVNGVSGTVLYENGTAENPSASLADATTLAVALGFSRLMVAPGSTITPTQGYDGFTIGSYGGNGWTMVLNGQSMSNATIIGAAVSGICTGANPPTFIDCTISAVTLPPSVLRDCGIGKDSGQFTAGSAGEFLFNNCFSMKAGAGAPVLVFSGLGPTTGINNRGWRGGATYTLDANCTLSHEVLAGGGTTVTTGGGAVEVRGITRSLTLTLSAAETVQFVGITGPISLSGTTTATVNLYGVSASVTDTTSAATVTDLTVNQSNINTQADQALSDYNPPTNAEMNARTLLAASYGTATNQATMQADLDNPNQYKADISSLALEATVAALNDISVVDILTTQMTESYAANGVAPTLAQAQFMIQQMIGEVSVVGLTITAKKIDGSTVAATFSTDHATSPTYRTRAT